MASPHQSHFKSFKLSDIHLHSCLLHVCLEVGFEELFRVLAPQTLIDQFVNVVAITGTS
jgi:hypothetical protein